MAEVFTPSVLRKIMLGPVIPLGINWAYYNDYYQWMANHETELKNLENMAYWRSLKNEAERNLPPSANRSPGFIPYRILKIREDIMITQLTYLLGEGGFNKAKNRYNDDRTCMKCGVLIKNMGRYLNALENDTRALVEVKKDIFKTTDEEYRAAQAKIMKKLSTQYTPLEIEKAQIYLPERLSRHMMSDIHGFCPACWEDTIKPKLGWKDSISK